VSTNLSAAGLIRRTRKPLYVPGGIVAWIDTRLQHPQSHLNSGDANGDRASQLQYAIQDMNCDTNLGGATAVVAKAHHPSRARSLVADHLLVTPNSGLNPAALVVA
jgi:hypothetical protein